MARAGGGTPPAAPRPARRPRSGPRRTDPAGGRRAQPVENGEDRRGRCCDCGRASRTRCSTCAHIVEGLRPAAPRRPRPGRGRCISSRGQHGRRAARSSRRWLPTRWTGCRPRWRWRPTGSSRRRWRTPPATGMRDSGPGRTHPAARGRAAGCTVLRRRVRACSTPRVDGVGLGEHARAGRGDRRAVQGIVAEPGRGTTVTPVIPLPVSPLTVSDVIRVLVVDDHPLFRGGLTGLLRHRGRTSRVVGAVGDGEAAVRDAAPAPPPTSS